MPAPDRFRRRFADRPAAAPEAGLSIEVHVPVVRPFRALRYDADVTGDLGRVVAPPYDVIGPDERRELLDRSPYNVVRLDLPAGQVGDTDPDDRYRRTGRLLSAWRSEGVLRRDPRPSIYVYEQQFRRPGGPDPEVRRGFFARVGLEPFGSGVLRHEQTLPGPREDRYRLLRTTNVNTSPVVATYDVGTDRVAGILEDVASGPPAIDVVDMVDERHRLWILTVGADARTGADARAEALVELASASSLTIADGHHRYETALRFQDEQRSGSAADPEVELGFDFVMMLLLEPGGGPLVVLPTHRVVLGLGSEGASALPGALAGLFDIEAGVTSERLLGTFGPAAPPSPGGGGRFGLWTRAGGFLLQARRAAFRDLLPAGGSALRRLDVTLLGTAIEAAAGIDAVAVAGGSRIRYTKDAAEAMALVNAGTDGADAAFLLDPTPAAEILAVARDGDVMPQKSTYIYPKAITGLVINPLEG